eukprot:SAG31_NODE_147_length_22539_cov_37.073663_20_plen_135_part_00
MQALDDISAVLIKTAQSKEGGKLSTDDISSLVRKIKDRPDANVDLDSANKLRTMGVFTAAAIFAHNFPEGLATFVGTLADPSAGGALAFAIGLVSHAIYYFTGTRTLCRVDALMLVRVRLVHWHLASLIRVFAA